MDFERIYMVMVAITGVVVAGTVALVIRQRVHESRQKVSARATLAALHRVPSFEDIELVPRGTCESCHRNRATVTVSIPGRPNFLVCQGCAPVQGIGASTIRPLTPDVIWVEVTAVTS